MKACWRFPFKLGDSETESQFEACPALVADLLLLVHQVKFKGNIWGQKDLKGCEKTEI